MNAKKIEKIKNNNNFFNTLKQLILDKTNNYIKRRIKSLSLVLLTIVIIIVTLGFLVFGDALLKLIIAFF